MRTVEAWKALLRARLKAAMTARQPGAVAVMRETLAAIDNAEAPAIQLAPTSTGGAFAGSTAGLGAGEVPRLALGPEAVASIIEREIAERRSAANEYARLGRAAEASVLSAQADLLVGLAAS